LLPESQRTESLGDRIKTAIDEDKISFILFGLSVVGSICCWSGCLVMPDWVYWGDKVHGLSFEITGPIFSLWAGALYIRGSGSRDRMLLATAERIAGAALTMQLVCWYLINLRTLKVRINYSDLSSQYTEEAYTYYVAGCVLNLISMTVTLHCIVQRVQVLKAGSKQIKALDQEWEAKTAGKAEKYPRAQVSKGNPKVATKPAPTVEAADPEANMLGDDDDDDAYLEPSTL